MQISQITGGFQNEGATATALALAPRPELQPVVIKPGLASGAALQAAAKIKLGLGPAKRMFGVSGIKDEDGASLLTAALGAALATLDPNPVLVVDANSRGSKLPGIFAARESPGLADLLEDRWDVGFIAQPAAPGNLFFLPLGNSGRSLASLIGSPRCTQIIDNLRKCFRYIAVDCGTLRDSPDSFLFASLCDGVVGALAAGSRRRNEVIGFQQELERLKIPLLGVALTKGRIQV